MLSRRRVLAFVLSAGALALLGARLFAGTELFGKPLRGLSAVPLAELASSPGTHAGKAVRVVGTVKAASSSEVTLSEGGATLVVVADSFSFPDKLEGARVTAEGRMKGSSLAATGAEVAR